MKLDFQNTAKVSNIYIGFNLRTCEIKQKKFTYLSCSIINIGINTHENN